MEECFNCGVPFSRVRLFDAISDEGVVKICEKCSREENIPIIRKPTTFQLKEAERKQTFYQKATLFGKEHQERKNPERKDQEITLREIVDRNYEQKVPKDNVPRPEMVNNFHWIIMRARRMKKITQSQLAKEIAESEAAIKMAEQGVLPEDDYRLVNKLENFLGIRIIRPEFAKEIDISRTPRTLSFDMHKSKELTIADLQEMKEKRGSESHTDSEQPEQLEDLEEFNLMNEEVEETKDIPLENSDDGGEISQEEMDRILFGK